MQNILNSLNKYYPLAPEVLEMLLPAMEAFNIKKGETLIPELQTSPYVYFIEKGAVKTYSIDEKGNKEVVWFGFEGDMCFSLSAYFDVAYQLETFEILEDSLLYKTDVAYFRHLHQTHLAWSNWARRFAEVHLVELFLEIDEHRPLNAKERYLSLLKKNPHIQDRVPLKDIASYLGVSPVTISRFRKEMK